MYSTQLIATDVCGNTTTSSTLEVGVWHDRGNPPASSNVFHANDSNQSDTRAGTNGTYGAGCGAGSACVNGTNHDHSDADPEMEIFQNASISVDNLRIDKASGGNLRLTWTEPDHQATINVTRFHVYRLDPTTLYWTQIAEVTKQTTSWTEPGLDNGVNYQYKVTAVIK